MNGHHRVRSKRWDEIHKIWSRALATTVKPLRTFTSCICVRGHWVKIDRGYGRRRVKRLVEERRFHKASKQHEVIHV